MALASLQLYKRRKPSSELELLFDARQGRQAHLPFVSRVGQEKTEEAGHEIQEGSRIKGLGKNEDALRPINCEWRPRRQNQAPHLDRPIDLFDASLRGGGALR